MEATNAIVNAIETINATVDQLVQQGNELCDDVDNLRAADEVIRASLAADKEHISANKEAIASQAKDLAELRATVVDLRSGLANDVVDLSSGVEAQSKVIEALGARVANIEQQLNMIARLQNELADSLLKLAETRATPVEASKDAAQTDAAQTDAAQTTGMAALIARIPKPDAVRTRATAQTPAPVVEASSKPVVQKDAAVPSKKTQATTNAVETRAYARQYMIENGAKIEQLRDPAAIEATVKSDAFAAWLATR